MSGSTKLKRYIPSRWPTGQFEVYKIYPDLVPMLELIKQKKSYGGKDK